MAQFFLGIRLPQELEAQCELWRRQFKAPRTIAHITVIAPFTWSESPGELIQLIQKSVDAWTELAIQGAGLGSFGERVLFVQVDLHPELKALQSKLAADLAGQGAAPDHRPYHPHITLASRLSPEQFRTYKELVKDFSPNYSFACRALSLFVLNSSRRWEESATIPLGASIQAEAKIE